MKWNFGEIWLEFITNNKAACSTLDFRWIHSNIYFQTLFKTF